MEQEREGIGSLPSKLAVSSLSSPVPALVCNTPIPSEIFWSLQMSDQSCVRHHEAPGLFFSCCISQQTLAVLQLRLFTNYTQCGSVTH
jgi:hypothetical protein